jgi:hypothetical protein
MEDNKYYEGKMNDPEDHGYVSFRTYNDGFHVLMGSRTDTNYRGKGIFKTQFERFINEQVKVGETVQIALVNRKLLPYLVRMGFKKTKEGVRYWGKIGNGVSLTMIKK